VAYRLLLEAAENQWANWAGMMERPTPINFFKQSLKSDSYYADELINIYLLRPIAAVIVWVLYPAPVTPNQLTVAAIIAGFAAALTYTFNTPAAIAVAGLLVTAKDILDDADGQLARAKQLYSRRGRFLDSIGDFVVDAALFAAITYVVFQTHPEISTILLGLLGLLGITLRVSYHVFYQVSFLHLEDRYKLNRIAEEITEEDLRGDRVALQLQRIFLLIYGWQDRLMYRIDRWCQGGIFHAKSAIDNPQSEISNQKSVISNQKSVISSQTEMTDDLLFAWYSDKLALRVSGLLGFGMEFALLTVCSLFNELYLYLLLNVFLMNGIWAGSVLYRGVVLRRNIE
jgi:phosphatidylglycerophosphate synthase